MNGAQRVARRKQLAQEIESLLEGHQRDAELALLVCNASIRAAAALEALSPPPAYLEPLAERAGKLAECLAQIEPGQQRAMWHEVRTGMKLHGHHRHLAALDRLQSACLTLPGRVAQG